MEHCICIRNSDYSLYAYILYVQDANRALDGWYHSKKKKQRWKQIEEKKSHQDGLSTPQTPNPAFCWCWFVGIVVALQLLCTDAAAIKAIRAELCVDASALLYGPDHLSPRRF